MAVRVICWRWSPHLGLRRGHLPKWLAIQEKVLGKSPSVLKVKGRAQSIHKAHGLRPRLRRAAHLTHTGDLGDGTS